MYASTITSYRVSRRNAMIVTFLLSACAHELVMVVVTQKIRMYLFLLQVRFKQPSRKLCEMVQERIRTIADNDWVCSSRRYRSLL